MDNSTVGIIMKLRSCAVAVFATAGFLAGCGGEDKEVGAVQTVPVAPTGPANGPLGTPCITADEWEPDFSGFQTSEINVSDGHLGCASGICLVNHFQGRVSCPYGQAAPGDPNQLDSPPCLLPDDSARVAVEVTPQLANRRSRDAATCSCRCGGPEGTGPFCSCPIGFKCVPLIEFATPDGNGSDLVGSYCIEAGTVYDPNMSRETCDWETQSCGPV